MKTSILLLLLLPASLLQPIYGVDVISFAYDAAGNRISRTIVMASPQTRSAENAEPQLFTDEFREKTVRIYPNPTEGQLKVEVTGWETGDNGALRLYAQTGELLLSAPMENSFTELNISSRPPGIYILQIELNSQRSSWKIIKK